MRLYWGDTVCFLTKRYRPQKPVFWRITAKINAIYFIFIKFYINIKLW